MDNENIEAEIHDLRRNIEVLKSRIDSEVPWYREASTIVAILALIFSLSTTAVSYSKAKEQEYISSRAELRSIMERLSDLPAKHLQLQKDYEENPTLAAQLSGQVNSDNLALSNLADAVIRRIEGTSAGKGKILDIELLSVATSLTSSFQHEKAKALLEMAQDRARDATTAAGIMRSLAGNYMYSNDIVAARRYMGKAREIYSNDIFKNDAPINQAVTNATTEIQWANMEMMLSDCAEAGKHLKEGKRLVVTLPPSLVAQQLTAQVVESRANLVNCSPIKLP